ncbi:MAG: hypothetical protein ACRD0Q_11580 [Acidimicrobiales bacterium]
MPLADSSGLDLLMGLAAVVTIVSVARAGAAFWDRDFTRADRRLASQVAVFCVPPLLVIVHELGHVAAAAVIGARVVGFHYGVFEGSVTVEGSLTASGNWLLAVSGSVVAALAGVALVVTGMRRTSMRPALRHVCLLGGVLTVLFNFAVYPLVSLAESAGDWVRVYDFSATPVLSGVTAVVHVGVVVGLMQWWQRRGQQALPRVAPAPVTQPDRSPEGP